MCSLNPRVLRPIGRMGGEDCVCHCTCHSTQPYLFLLPSFPPSLSPSLLFSLLFPIPSSPPTVPHHSVRRLDCCLFRSRQHQQQRRRRRLQCIDPRWILRWEIRHTESEEHGGGGESLLDQPTRAHVGRTKGKEREREVKFGRGSFTLITRIKVRRGRGRRVGAGV